MTHTCGCVPYLRNVRQDELEVDDLDVADGVHGAVHVDDVVVDKCSDNLTDGIRLSNGGEELVPEAFAFRCPSHNSGDVDEGDRSRQDSLGAVDRG